MAGMDASERAAEGAAAAPATAAQVRRLVLVARSAWRTQRDLGLTDDGFDRWRGGVLWDACSEASFRALGQRGYGRAMAAFLRLGGGAVRTAAGSRPAGAWGRANEAAAARESGPDGDRRRAEFKLREACRAAAGAFGSEAGALAYARGLLRAIHKRQDGREFEGATARQLWQTMFTVRSRAARRRAPGARGAGFSGGGGRGACAAPPEAADAARALPPAGEAILEGKGGDRNAGGMETQPRADPEGRREGGGGSQGRGRGEEGGGESQSRGRGEEGGAEVTRRG